MAQDQLFSLLPATSVGDCVFILSTDHVIAGANQNTLNLVGKSRKDLLGKPIGAVLGAHKRGRTALADLLGKPEPQDLTLYTEDQRPLPVVFRSSPVVLHDGREWLVCVARPKSSETFRSWGKAQADMLRQSHDEFLSNMSHELRTPLTGIMGMTQILETTSLDAEQREHLDVIQECSSSLLAFVEQVLTFKDVRSGRRPARVVSFRPGDLVSHILDRYEPSIVSKDLGVTMHLDEDVPRTVVGDRDNLSQILVCLLDNAVKFTEPGGHLGVRVVRESAEGEQLRLRLSIRDTGVGIPVSKQELVFEPFQQADGTTTRRFSGGGLGLSLARELTRLLEGELWMDSSPGWGSEFHLSVPVSVPEGGLGDGALLEEMDG